MNSSLQRVRKAINERVAAGSQHVSCVPSASGANLAAESSDDPALRIGHLVSVTLN